MAKQTTDLKARARKRASEMNTSVWFKLKEGDNIIRVLPTPESKKSPPLWYEYNVHRDVGPKKQTVRCGKDIEGEGDCWMCDVTIPKLIKKGAAGRAAALESKPVFLVQIASVVMEDEDTPKFSGPYLWSPSKTVSAALLSKVIGSKKRVYEDPEKGYNITINRVGTGKNDTRYGTLEADDEQTEVPESIIKKLKPFSELKEVTPYDEAKQKAVYTGTDQIDDEDEDEDDAPPKKKKVQKSDDDDDSDTVDDDDDDDAAPPKKKEKVTESKKKKPPVTEDDDDDDTDSDDDDDEPAPKPKKKKPSVMTDDDDDTVDDDDDEPAPKPKGKKKPPVTEDDDDDDTDSDDDDDEPAPKKKKKPSVTEDDDDDDTVDDDDDPPPPPKKKAPLKKKNR